ncbi:MAG: four helix bundle protein [Bacteroidetes bacterium]|nr:MAG: four helix bundle protein [Bacteroidota bacterium]
MEKGHKKLLVWQEAMELVMESYTVADLLPSDERYGLMSQMKRSAVSVPANIAEGAARQGAKDSVQFFVIARSSLSELDTHLEIVRRRRMVPEASLARMQQKLDTVDSLLSGLIRYRRNTTR